MITPNVTESTDELQITALPHASAREGKLGPFHLSAHQRVAVQRAPLTIFVGPQGSGKSLLMQLIFLGQAFPYLAAQFVDREEEIEPRLLLKSLLDRLRRGEVRDKRRGFNSLVKQGAHIVYQRRTPWRDYGGMSFRVYQTQNMPHLDKHFSEWVHHLTQSVGWREKWLRPVPSVFIPAERTFYSRFLNGAPDVLQSPTLPLTMRSFTRTLNLAMETFMGWSNGTPTTEKARWVAKRARQALGGEAYIPPRGPRVVKWRLADGTIHDLEMASSGQMEAWPLILTAMCLLEWQQDGTVANDVSLYVEEPEVHLHPQAQLEILHILAYLVNEGIHVTLTTHSPMLLFLLNALLRSSHLSAQTENALRQKFGEQLLLPPLASRLKSEQVAVYAVTPAGVSNLMTDGEIDEDYLREAEWTIYKYFNSIQAVLEATPDALSTH